VWLIHEEACGREKETLAIYHVRMNELAKCIPWGPRPNVHQGNFTYKTLYKGETIQHIYL
jgi:hypothetical protein